MVIVTKKELAALFNVHSSTVASWIARGQLTAPALLADGRVDLEMAKQQLAERIDLARSRARAPAGLFKTIDKPSPAAAAAAAPAAGPGHAAEYARRLAAARADALQLALDRRRFDALIASGRIVPVAALQRRLGSALRELILVIETKIVDEWALAAITAPNEETAIADLRDRVRAYRRNCKSNVVDG